MFRDNEQIDQDLANTVKGFIEQYFAIPIDERRDLYDSMTEFHISGGATGNIREPEIINVGFYGSEGQPGRNLHVFFDNHTDLYLSGKALADFEKFRQNGQVNVKETAEADEEKTA